MSVVAKFRVTTVDGDGDVKTIRLQPVVGGSPENDAFFKYTPGGEITLLCVNESATKQFVVGAEMYVHFDPVDTAG